MKPEPFAQVLLDEAENEQTGEPNNTDWTGEQWSTLFIVALLAGGVFAAMGWMSWWKVGCNAIWFGIVLVYFAVKDPK